MRFEELHLERFGHFDGLRLDLSGEDVLLHLVYGPNEAGKSTALAAICDLLFGIPERTSFNFRHEYGRLRIGGTLTNTAGQRLSFKRRKARVNSLLRPDESAELPENSLAPYLGGATREFFERMFGLNHERLRAGGRAMLDAGGEVARSLLAARCREDGGLVPADVDRFRHELSQRCRQSGVPWFSDMALAIERRSGH
jgi:chromosome segregation protein